MEQAFANKGFFLTGGTGFVGKALIEKLLRCIPTIDKIYVLIRPKKGLTSAMRLKKEIIESPIFDRLQRERPLDCNTFLHTKLHAITGDVTSPMLGISKRDQQLLSQCVHITIHCAATVQFNESLDVAVEMNCLGAMYAFDFIQTYCPLVQVHCHVSTAYVNSNLRQQLHIQEELYPLDFDPEEAVESIIKASATELDRLHVNLIGTYPNTYALTKSMAEHLITKRSINIPLVIYRPTIIGAAWKEPVPGWIDQIAGAGAIFLACGMGVLTMLPGDPRNIADIVPVDFCVNSLLISCYTQLMKTTMTNGMPKPLIVHCGTSDPRQNPLKWRIPLRIIPEYWQKNPPKRQLFPAKFQMYPTHQQFQMAWFFSYAMPSSVYSTVANRIGQTKHVKNAARLWQLTWRARNLVEIFKPFTENQWIFVTNTINNVLLAQSVSFSSSSSLWWSLDTKEIAWERYLFNFCVGLKKYILQEEVIDVDIEGVNHTELALSTNRMLTWDPDHHAISFPGLFSDLSWAYTSSRKPGYTHSGLLGRLLGLTGWKEGMNHEASHVPRPHIDSVSTLRNEVLESSNVQKAIEQEALLEGKSIDEINQKAMDILNEMAAQIDYTSVRKMGWFLRKVCRQMYEKIHVDEKGFTHLRDLVRACHEKNGHCIILLPTHRSYGDFLLMSYLFFAYNLPVPYIAAGKDFLQMGPWLSQLLRESGAFFIERSFKQKELLYTAIFQEYTQYLLTRGHLIEFFIEGKRSRSGKQLHPKFGLLHTILETFLTGKIQNVYLVPVTIDYEKPLEVMLHQNEMLGQGKIKETLGSFLKSLQVIRKSFGSISVQFGHPIDVKAYVTKSKSTQVANAFITKSNWDPFRLTKNLAYEITHAMIQSATCTPSNLVASILLVYRHGISRKDLVVQTNFIRLEILKRGGRVMETQGRSPQIMVERALEYLKEYVNMRRKDFIEPAIVHRDQYPNMLGLGYYRNKILHWFHQESVLACTYHALSQKQKHDATFTISLCLLLDHACFLYEMLWMEFVRQDCTQDRMELQQTLDQMSKSNKEDNQVLFVLLQEQDKDPQKRRIVLAETSYGKTMYALLCTLMWPFIDSYWVAVMSLFALRQPNVDISMEELLKRMQWLAETMYHEKIISFYESCSLETLENAIQMLEKAHVIEFFTPSKENKNDKQKTTTKIFVRLAKPFLHQPQSSCSPRHTMNTTTLAWKTQSLEELAAFIGQFRKLPAIFSDKNEGRESQLIASLPALARL